MVINFELSTHNQKEIDVIWLRFGRDVTAKNNKPIQAGSRHRQIQHYQKRVRRSLPEIASVTESAKQLDQGRSMDAFWQITLAVELRNWHYSVKLSSAKTKSQSNTREQRWADCPDRRAADVITFAGEVLKRAEHFNALTQ